MAASNYPGPNSGKQAVFTFPYGMPADFIYGGNIASGSTSLDIWTPGTGNKFRLMGFTLSISGGATQGTAGDLQIFLKDGTATIPGCSWYTYVGTSAVSFDTVLVPTILLCGGYLSSATNNILSLNLGSALTGGHVNITVFGLEEVG